jgi:hypothetical protein
LKGCTKKINNYLSDKFRTIGWIKPGVEAEEELDSLTVELVNLKKCASTNDVYRNNPNEALMKIVKFIQNNGNTNIMILGIPHILDLVEFSCINRAVRIFNYKLKKVLTHLIMLLYWSVIIIGSISINMHNEKLNNLHSSLMPYYIKYKMPSNLRHIQFLNVVFQGKIRNVHTPRI